jgi:predicted dehydrogenase
LIGREHVRFIEGLPSTELAAIADVSSEAAELAKKLGVPYYSDYEVMLNEARPDAAIVALPNALHVPAALSCIRHGVPVLVEKPIAEGVGSAIELVKASEAADVPVLVGHQRRHSPDIRDARKCVREGQLGELVAVQGSCLLCKHQSYFDVAWRREQGGGPLLINLIHDIDCLRFICGEIESVQAICSNRIRRFPVEDTSAIIIRFCNGALGTFLISDAVPSPWVWDLASGQAPYFPHTHADCYHIGGTKASLAVPSMELWWHQDGGDWRDPLTHRRLPTEHSNCYLNQLNHLADIVRTGAEPLTTARDGMLTLAATLAVDVAAREGRPVVVADLVP